MRSFLIPAVLAAVLVGELLVAPGLLDPGRGSKGLASVHAAANFGAEPVRHDDLERLLGSRDPLWRDFAMTWDLTRSVGGERQRAHLEALENYADAAIGNFFLRYQVRSPDLEALRVYFDALERRRADAATD